MVILITGATHCGKTLLAQRLVEKLRYPCVSLDLLKMGLIRSGQTALTPVQNAELTEYLWPIAAEMVKTAVENRQDLIMEGCYIPESWRGSFTEPYLAHIRLVALCFSDDYIHRHYADILDHANDIEQRLDDSHVTEPLLLRENRRYARSFGPDAAVIHDNYEEALASLLSGFQLP